MTIIKKNIFEYFWNCSNKNIGKNENMLYLLVLIEFEQYLTSCNCRLTLMNLKGSFVVLLVFVFDPELIDWLSVDSTKSTRSASTGLLVDMFVEVLSNDRVCWFELYLRTIHQDLIL